MWCLVGESYTVSRGPFLGRFWLICVSFDFVTLVGFSSVVMFG